MSDLLHVLATVQPQGLDVDLHVTAGEHIAVVGPNGAGKSTLMRLIAGSLRTATGIVALEGNVVSDTQHHLPPHQRRVAYVEQRPTLFPHLDVLHNVMFGPLARGASKRDARQRALAELEATDCETLIRRRPHQLSGGQAQRVAIARALATDPAIVLLDEPFAALDVTVAPALRQLLSERLRGQTTILVTHDLVDVMTLADRLVALEQGRINADGPVHELVQTPTTRFLADLSGLNLLELGRSTRSESVGADVLALGSDSSKTRLLSFPPEALRIAAADRVDGNCWLDGIIRSIEPARGCVELGIDVDGQLLRSRMTLDEFALDGPQIGQAIQLALDLHQVRVCPAR